MLRSANEGIEVWLYVEPVGFRKQSTGLATLVQDTLAMDPFSAHLFLFTNRRRTQSPNAIREYTRLTVLLRLGNALTPS